MNKILIPLAVIIGLYAAYSHFSTEGDDSGEIKGKKPVVITEAMKRGEEPIPFVPDEVVPDVNVDPLLGEYEAEIDNDNVIATIKVTLMEGNRISHTRYINRNGNISEGTVEGVYVVQGNRLTFNFPAQRDMDVFKMEQLILDVEDGQLVSGLVTFTKV